MTLSFAIIGLAMVAGTHAQQGPATPTSLVNFNGTDGATPQAALIPDANGNLFGTTESGGAHSRGTVFELVKTASGYSSTPDVLVSFGSYAGDGAFPLGTLLADSTGDLFGTTANGGPDFAGTVFEIVKTASGYASTSTILASFSGQPDGEFPSGRLIADGNGNLFGTTEGGGTSDQGTVFELVKSDSGYRKTILASFNGADGQNPAAGLLADADGNLLGTTSNGGVNDQGTVFEMTRTGAGYDPPIDLVSFNGANGANPAGDLLADASGNLFSTTFSSGANEAGTVFEIVKTAGGYASTPLVLLDFNGTDGGHPNAGLITDANGSLFGTTFSGGMNGHGAGTVFEIAKTRSGYAGTEIVLASFDGTNGDGPAGALLADAKGNLLFGTTVAGGTSRQGTVFEVAVFAGTPGAPNCFGQSTSALARQYRGVDRAATALGYSSAAALQDAIRAFCER